MQASYKFSSHADWLKPRDLLIFSGGIKLLVKEMKMNPIAVLMYEGSEGGAS